MFNYLLAKFHSIYSFCSKPVWHRRKGNNLSWNSCKTLICAFYRPFCLFWQCPTQLGAPRCTWTGNVVRSSEEKWGMEKYNVVQYCAFQCPAAQFPAGQCVHSPPGPQGTLHLPTSYISVFVAAQPHPCTESKNSNSFFVRVSKLKKVP